MAQPGAETPQQAQLQQPQAMPAVESTDNLAGAVPVAVVDEGEPTQYQIVRSQTGKNYVQVRPREPCLQSANTTPICHLHNRRY